jgi:hypothetical protein
MAQRDGVYLACRDKAADDFPYLAAGSEGGQEELNIFHAGGNHGLQIDGGKY